MRQLMMIRFALLVGLAVGTFAACWRWLHRRINHSISASQFVKIGNDTRAVEEFQHFLTSFPTDPRLPQATFLLGYSYQQLRKYDKAIAEYLQASIRRSAMRRWRRAPMPISNSRSVIAACNQKIMRRPHLPMGIF